MNEVWEEKLFRENLSYIRQDTVRKAYETLRSAAKKHGLRQSILKTGGGRPLRMYGIIDGKERYLFSVDRARYHLTFYVRAPALQHVPGARRAALLCLDPHKEAGGQISSKITTEQQAHRIIAGLFVAGGWDASPTSGR